VNSDPAAADTDGPAMSDGASLSAGHLPSVITMSRLRWQCRRGMRELDVVFQRYLEQRYPHAPLAEQRAFEALLELQDPQLLNFLVGREIPADPELVNVVARLANAGA
jgi:antitoxin CptB